MVRLNIGINRAVRQPHRKTKIEHKNVTGVCLSGTWANGKELHEEVKAYIHENYPGWGLTGYALIDEEN